MIENNFNNNELPSESQRTQNRNGAGAERQNSRRESVSSLISSSTTSPHYDSGNISDLNLNFCPASLSSADDDSISSDSLQQNKINFLLREKDQSLFLALQDGRKLKSELERLSKSEKWYKSELKLQRNSKLEVLEKLYTNERRFTQDNQNLQNERIALYARCSDLENQLQVEKDSAMKLLKHNQSRPTILSDEVDSRDFELQQHQQRLADQDQLIDILRNQKRSLLNDLQKLGCERDEIVLQLQKSIAQLEDENRTITKRCLQLVESKIALTDEISSKESDWKGMSNEVLDLQIVVRKLQEKLHSHIAEINHKDQVLNSLKHELLQQQDVDSDLLIKHQKELFQKEQSIQELNETINTLKIEIIDLQSLHQTYNDQQCEIDTLRSKLQAQTSQIEKFQNLEEQKSKSSDVLETQQQHQQKQQQTLATNNIIPIEEIEQILMENKELQIKLDSLKSSQSLEQNNLRITKAEIQQISEKYQNICKLYETSKFELDMKEITVEKLRFEKEKDTHEIKSLRQKLLEISNQLDCQRTLGTEFEFLLSKTQQEMNRLKTENQCNIDRILKLKIDTNQSVERCNQKDIQIEDLKAKLLAEKELNAKLISSNSAELMEGEQKSQNGIKLMEKLMSLQVGKVEQLNAEQQEWENLLTSIEHPMKLDVPCSEFDDLNQLFDEQNIELIELNEKYHRQSESLKKAFDVAQEENQIFKEKLKMANLKISDLESQIESIESANVDYQKEIAHLAGTNERLIEEFNKDFSQERESHKKQIKQFQSEAKLRNEENAVLREKMQAEIDSIKSSQKLHETVVNDNQHQQKSEQERILENVLDKEHQRKMIRYDLHIRTLLSNVKSYKRNLEIVENRYDALKMKSKDMVEVEQFRAMESALQDMRTQFGNSQREIENLKYQLKTINEQFYVTDASKSINTMDLTNLMDDYKKLIQQSHIATKRPSTSEIYKLINKSNSFVPKLTNISNSVDKLREDVQQICTVINVSSSGRTASPQLKMSLMDELSLADNKK